MTLGPGETDGVSHFLWVNFPGTDDSHSYSRNIPQLNLGSESVTAPERIFLPRPLSDFGWFLAHEGLPVSCLSLLLTSTPDGMPGPLPSLLQDTFLPKAPGDGRLIVLAVIKSVNMSCASLNPRYTQRWTSVSALSRSGQRSGSLGDHCCR